VAEDIAYVKGPHVLMAMAASYVIGDIGRVICGDSLVRIADPDVQLLLPTSLRLGCLELNWVATPGSGLLTLTLLIP
jgi:hypothetical protein